MCVATATRDIATAPATARRQLGGQGPGSECPAPTDPGSSGRGT
ncbi:hypothetical protein [Streptomyces sp. NPDC051098]